MGIILFVGATLYGGYLYLKAKKKKKARADS